MVVALLGAAGAIMPWGDKPLRAMFAAAAFAAIAQVIAWFMDRHADRLASKERNR
jgi:hypothetical protein